MSICLPESNHKSISRIDLNQRFSNDSLENETEEKLCNVVKNENLCIGADLHRANKAADVSKYTDRLFRSDVADLYGDAEDGEESREEIIISNIILDGQEMNTSFLKLHLAVTDIDVSKPTTNLYRIGWVVDSSDDEVCDEDDVNEMVLSNIHISNDLPHKRAATSECDIKGVRLQFNDDIPAEPGCSKWNAQRPASHFNLSRKSSARKLFDRLFKRGRTQSTPFTSTDKEDEEGEKKHEMKTKPKRKFFKKRKEKPMKDTGQVLNQTQDNPKGQGLKFQEGNLSEKAKAHTFSLFKWHRHEHNEEEDQRKEIDNALY